MADNTPQQIASAEQILASALQYLEAGTAMFAPLLGAIGTTALPIEQAISSVLPAFAAFANGAYSLLHIHSQTLAAQEAAAKTS